MADGLHRRRSHDGRLAAADVGLKLQGWIAPAECVVVRVTMTDNERMHYAAAEPEERYKLCSTAHTKIAVVKSILARHPDEPTLVNGALRT